MSKSQFDQSREKIGRHIQHTMEYDDIRTLEFAIFCIENLAVRLHIKPRDAYDMLTKRTDLLQSYIIPSYDVLHTQDKEYIIEDIVEALKLKGMAV